MEKCRAILGSIISFAFAILGGWLSWLIVRKFLLASIGVRILLSLGFVLAVVFVGYCLVLTVIFIIDAIKLNGGKN